jgi:hypothetical protein
MANFIGYEPSNKALRGQEFRNHTQEHEVGSYQRIHTSLIHVLSNWTSYAPADRVKFRHEFVNMLKTTGCTWLLTNEEACVDQEESPPRPDSRMEYMNRPFTPALPRVGEQAYPRGYPVPYTQGYTVPVPHWSPMTDTPHAAQGTHIAREHKYAHDTPTPRARRPMPLVVRALERQTPSGFARDEHMHHPNGGALQTPAANVASLSRMPDGRARTQPPMAYRGPWDVPNVHDMSADAANLLIRHEIEQNGMMQDGFEVMSSAGSSRSHRSVPASLASLSSGSSSGSGGSVHSDISQLSVASLANHNLHHQLSDSARVVEQAHANQVQSMTDLLERTAMQNARHEQRALEQEQRAEEQDRRYRELEH